jgi:hypothetical protein
MSNNNFFPEHTTVIPKTISQTHLAYDRLNTCGCVCVLVSLSVCDGTGRKKESNVYLNYNILQQDV